MDGAEILLHSFVTSALDGGEWTTPRTGRFNPEANLIRGQVGGRAGVSILETIKNSSPCRDSDSGPPSP
jgi:hypothetical protein